MHGRESPWRTGVLPKPARSAAERCLSLLLRTPRASVHVFTAGGVLGLIKGDILPDA